VDAILEISLDALITSVEAQRAFDKRRAQEQTEEQAVEAALAIEYETYLMRCLPWMLLLNRIHQERTGKRGPYILPNRLYEQTGVQSV
jgi:hypothetical protein